MITIRVSNGLDPDQDRRSVDPDLGPNCLQRLSANYKSRLSANKGRVNGISNWFHHKIRTSSILYM